MSKIINVSIRQSAIFVHSDQYSKKTTSNKDEVWVLIANLNKLGFSVSEELLNALFSVNSSYLLTILDIFKESLCI